MPLSPEDRLEIRELVARYDHATDAHEAAARADTFAEDGVFDPSGPALEGRQAILNARRPETGRDWRHWTDNFVIEGDGDRAEARCYLIVWRVGNPPHIQLTGVYRDRFTKIDGAWRFQYRDFVRDDLGDGLARE